MKILAIDDEKIALEGLVCAIKEAEPSADIFSFQKVKDAIEFYKENVCEVAFLDIQMMNVSGIELAKRLKLINPKINIIFVTGYSDYSMEAFQMHASGYLLKPVTAQMIRKELDNLRHPVKNENKHRVQISAFGNFEVFVDGVPVQFKYERTKEMLAYLVDRNGKYCTNAEIMTTLWEDEKRPSYLSNLKKDLSDTFRENDCTDIIDTGWGKLRINPDKIDCDYYDWCDGKYQAINQYRGEYMHQYSWAEFTNAELNRETGNK